MGGKAVKLICIVALYNLKEKFPNAESKKGHKDLLRFKQNAIFVTKIWAKSRFFVMK